MIRYVFGRMDEMVTNPATGRLSSTRLASATAHALVAFWFCWHNYHTGFNWEMWGLYITFAGGHHIGNKIVALKFGGQPGAGPVA